MTNIISFPKLKDSFELCEKRNTKEQTTFLLERGETPFTIAKSRVKNLLSLHQKGQISYEQLDQKISGCFDILSRYHPNEQLETKRA